MASLRAIIADEIRRHGPIPFSRYMELCLYHADLGYYSRAQEKFGKAGDFYTSSDVHAVFGRLLARQFEEMWRALGEPPRLEIIELGPGRGLFARDVIDWSARRFPKFHAAMHYLLVERSPGLRQKLFDTLRDAVNHGKAEIAASLPAAPRENAIVFANEFFDALPVDVIAHEGLVQVGEEEGKFVESFVPPGDEHFDFLDRYSVRPQEGERVEVCRPALEHAAKIAATMKRGFAVLIDYGYTRPEQVAGRHLDTLMCYREHQASEDPYQAPGEQDITAHVNFTALEHAAQDAGMRPLGLVTQSQFLLGIGEETQFADAFEGCSIPQEHAKVALQLKHLVTPAGMGETFHVLVLAQGLEAPPPLAGLGFARK
ncbi:MAG TPA: SAM-dependent methyltransferase [Terriglobales bacterium]|nr:SAM-dependent methyltransferase [Terriglobales bacterium]